MSIDLKNIREAVAIFDELKLDLEVLKTQLDDNFKNYQSIGDISTQNIDKFQDVLQSVNTLQINTESSLKDALKSTHKLKHEMGEYYSQEFINTKKNLDDLLSEMNSAFYTLKKTINDSIENGINDVVIDTSKLEAKVAKTLDHINLFEFKSSVERIEKANNNFITAGNTLLDASQKIETTTDTINQSIENINNANNSLSMATAFFIAMGFTVFGFFLANYFKIDAMSDYYFSEYNQHLKTLEVRQNKTEKELKSLDKLSQFLIDHNIKITLGKFNKSDISFIRFNNVYSDEGQEYTFSRDGYHFVGAKE